MECIQADRSRLIVVYGRRRVGKTFLIRESFDYKFTFTHTGLEKGGYREQLSEFWHSLKRQWKADCRMPSSWSDAFELLKDAVSESTDARKTIFIDELPWMDTRNSGFLSAVEGFWNGWASARKDVVMVVCGSAAAWMTKKVLQNKGGLFNRANRTIYLEPFTLAECEAYVKAEGLVMDRKDIVSAYMVFGGAPYYWSLLDKSESLSQNIDRLFFAKNGDLAHEFSRLYRSVFANPEPYVAVVTALGARKAGMTRDEIVQAGGASGNNGNLTACLDNLERSGFIRRYPAIGRTKRDSVYQLIDNYTLFHFRFAKDRDGEDAQFWSHSAASPARSTWQGLAFERVCLEHARQIKKALGVAGVATSVSSWRLPGDGAGRHGAQIDLVISRADNVTNLCEMKFCQDEYEIDAEEAVKLRNRVEAFRRETGTKGGIHLTFVTPYGVRRNKYWNLVQSEVTLDDLFADA
jgi:hypothetical protein